MAVHEVEATTEQLIRMQQLVMNSSEELSLIVEAAVDIAVGGDSATAAAIISFVKYFQQFNLFNHV